MTSTHAYIIEVYLPNQDKWVPSLNCVLFFSTRESAERQIDEVRKNNIIDQYYRVTRYEPVL